MGKFLLAEQSFGLAKNGPPQKTTTIPSLQNLVDVIGQTGQTGSQPMSAEEPTTGRTTLQALKLCAYTTIAATTQVDLIRWPVIERCHVQTELVC